MPNMPVLKLCFQVSSHLSFTQFFSTHEVKPRISHNANPFHVPQLLNPLPNTDFGPGDQYCINHHLSPSITTEFCWELQLQRLR